MGMTPSAGGVGTPISGRIGTPGRAHMGGQGHRGLAISLTSSFVVLGVLALFLFAAPGSAKARHAFLSPSHMWQALIGNQALGEPSVGTALLINIKMFLIAEVLILAFALVIAVVRQSRGPALLPLRLLATAYVDIFRGVPLILVIYAIGFGLPALYLKVVSTQSAVTYAILALVLSYSAYVSEVYRAGLNSVHQGQVSAARSLGLSEWHSMRYVILPQAIRTILPALLNDFISLQKDTALASVLAVIEANEAANLYSSASFNYSGYVVAAALFLILTIPLARFTDRLIARDRARRLATIY
jgi:polar amino acid transport system permease protein